MRHKIYVVLLQEFGRHHPGRIPNDLVYPSAQTRTMRCQVFGKILGEGSQLEYICAQARHALGVQIISHQ